ncbi:MAG TPA: ArsA-related P-loop ATPase [Solirubrobacteraceae bacterium]|nr:ArsA-related P-loop ATPase [Solirubrobacteraceae bacterium]
MSVATRMAGKRICICTGAGGVGKTTTAAAVAVGLAARGQRVAVLTIDPARRLASSLGLEQLDNEPRRVHASHFAGHGLELSGELWAMMLDSKRTFDELIELLAPNADTYEAILDNRIYQELSSAVAGSQEFSAMAKLYELDASRRYDAIVLDTPPSRNALDFLYAPQRLTGFLQGRALKVLTAPTGFAAALAARSSGLVFSALRRVTGIDLLADLSTFFGVLSSVVDGFADRATAVASLLADPATTFLIVTSPEPTPVEEAIFFRRCLAEAGMPFGGLVVNRLRVLARTRPAIDEASLAGDFGGDVELAAKSVQALRDMRALAKRDATSLRRLTAEVDDAHPILVPQLDRDVSDMAGLVAVQHYLFATPRERSALLAEQAF